jgi:type IV/VI secretion system ImpK/VasF family protein
MSVEPSSALWLNQIAIPYPAQIQQGYYRSKLFTLTSSTNPILAAASPLFSLLERFSVTQTLPPIEAARENIEHEWKSFRSKLASLNYVIELMSIAEYLLSATIDEFLGKTYLRLQGTPAQFMAFTPLSHDNIGPQQRFFDIVQHMKERANQYLDLLELAYYCLTLGFEGEYHQRTDGRATLDNLIQELYDMIQENRVHKPLRLFRETRETQPVVQHSPMVWKAALIGLGVLIVSYIISQNLLDHRAKTLYVEQAQRINLDR